MYKLPEVNQPHTRLPELNAQQRNSDVKRAPRQNSLQKLQSLDKKNN